ncbi:hypothetical protein KK120_13395 [Virgibacillus dakarensis]|uniref:hypothetical protein n=1 Tax=Lentibacillus populi TaxID=1827502 RepID=UPI000C84FFDD|nr:hypothetical protein [Lentibacillus populi]MBT2216819.1 hypothetical protein [Virgibacillus dakarensis]
MIGFIIAIILFNLVCFTTNKRLTKNQFVHIWTFTIALQAVTETFIDFKYHGYWYFSKEINWWVLPAFTILIPPVNIIFLNWYPFKKTFYKQMLYILCWTIAITLYEAAALLPEPWGYFHHSWWSIWYSLLVNPFLLIAVLSYYRWICKIESCANLDKNRACFLKKD